MSDATLFALYDEREVTTGPHVLLPNMSYACGGDITTKTGGFMFIGPDNFGDVGCPACAAIGHDDLRAAVRIQQGRCPDCAAINSGRDHCQVGA